MARINSIPTPAIRDQEASAFSHILVELCRATGARCAALVDQEGETVDYGGAGDPFDIRILAAEWRLVFAHVEHANKLGGVSEMTVRARDKSFLIVGFPLGYALVVQLARRSTGLSPRALSQARRELCKEAGFSADGRGEVWLRVHVKEEPGVSRRPLALSVEAESHYVTVLGLLKSSIKRERGFRIRLGSGEERTLVREPLGQWYLEQENWT